MVFTKFIALEFKMLNILFFLYNNYDFIIVIIKLSIKPETKRRKLREVIQVYFIA